MVLFTSTWLAVGLGTSLYVIYESGLKAEDIIAHLGVVVTGPIGALIIIICYWIEKIPKDKYIIKPRSKKKC